MRRLRFSGWASITVLVTSLTALPARSVAAAATADPGYGHTVTSVSSDQYHLSDSDGTTWQPLNVAGGRPVSLSITPTAESQAVITGNADLWTATAGYNQDLGIFINGRLAAWKESGGFAGTFSPNAATVQTVASLTAGAAYTIDLRWKTNRPGPGTTIFAGAGPYPAGSSTFSPTRLTAYLAPASAASVSTISSQEQFSLRNSDGVTWQPMAEASGYQLGMWVFVSTPTLTVITGNADLWTDTAGVNQDLAISLNWQESGGFAGTFSPNAAFVQAVVSLPSGSNWIQLYWKTNKPASGATIYAGAGPYPGGTQAFSPTRLTAVTLTSAASGWNSGVASKQQYRLDNSDGTTFRPMNYSVYGDAISYFVASPAACLAIIGGDAGLFTDTAGVNQDIGIFVDGTLVAWKESGGFAGTFSPNAAYVQAVVPFTQGDHTITLEWKTNKPAGSARIYAGAGPIPDAQGYGSSYSPTSLISQLTDCA